MGHFSKLSYYPMVILVDTFAQTYRKFRFLRLTNILSGNELIEFDCKCLWKNMTNIMGEENDTQSSLQWLTIHPLYAHVIANVVIDGTNKTQHCERSNVILRNFIRIGTFQKCLSDSYLRPLQLFPTYVAENNVNASSNCLLFSMWLLRGANFDKNSLYELKRSCCRW